MKNAKFIKRYYDGCLVRFLDGFVLTEKMSQEKLDAMEHDAHTSVDAIPVNLGDIAVCMKKCVGLDNDKWNLELLYKGKLWRAAFYMYFMDQYVEILG